VTESAITVWIVDDDESVRWVLEQAFSQAGMDARAFPSGSAFFADLGSAEPDVVVTDVRMPDMSGLVLMERLAESHADIPVIVITAHSDLEAAVAAYKTGAFEYLPKPFDIDAAVDLVQRAAAQHRSKNGGSDSGTVESMLIGKAPSMQNVFKAIGQLSRSSMTVLITGESGTGKELVARALHMNSPRANEAFIALDTSAIAAELLESELFGHEKGAFTGATERRIGRFEQADRGTIFLDEIGDMSLALQTRLLRVLAEGEFYRVGGTTPIRVDVRVLAATHRDLSRAVGEGMFRADLYHRLNVVRIPVPPLRERKEDIPALARHYLELAASELGFPPKTLDRQTEAAMQRYDWPGNVRELVNVCRRLTATVAGRHIAVQDLPPEFANVPEPAAASWTVELSRWASKELARNSGEPLLARALPAFERTVILAALEATRGKRRDAAKRLGWGRNTLTRKMRELGLDDYEFGGGS
jgi:two-component system, NtrC family, nitrogen regulation response regulator GlnG